MSKNRAETNIINILASQKIVEKDNINAERKLKNCKAENVDGTIGEMLKFDCGLLMESHLTCL